jgi:hypothetical protein
MTSGRRLLLIAAVLCTAPIAAGAADQPQVRFETDIQPVLARRCGQCHDGNLQKADLDLSTMAGVRRGGESGESLIGETLDESLLWLMIDGGGMPPEDEPALSEDELALIRRWLDAGAPSSAADGEPQLTQHDVLPILLLRCAACHGRQRQDGKLDLRTPASIMEGGRSGPALVPGDPDASRMIQRIESEACPPRNLLLKFFVKRPPSAEVEILRNWIAAGAPVANVPADVATTDPDPLVTEEDRQHWAFQPPVATAGADSIDEFIGAKLRERGIDFAPEADRDTLIRRAFLDLTGLPPTIEQWQQWRSSDGADWYETLIDTLLASPRYGERWGRYWLDLAGYADSEGGVSADPVRPVAWKYRDYVIDAFNSDKPYDRFLLEQLAGDELIDCESADEITEEMVSNLVATGFLRMGIDQTGSRTMNFVPERIGVISDAITVVSSGVMGLTMECARCHSHKYDPIPHRDYYRFKAIFQGALDEHDWLSFRNRTLELGTPQQRERVADVNPPLERQLKQLTAKLRQATADAHRETLRAHYPEQSEEDREATLVALKVADNTRTLPQRLLVEKLQKAELLPDSEQPESVIEARQAVAAIEREMTLVGRRMEPSLTIRALWDRGEPSPTYVLRRGEHDKPGRLVGPGVPSVLTDGRTPFDAAPPFADGTAKTGRRLAFARWLTRPDHPLTARVMVNRIWYHHFGAGLVATLENFGRQAERPSHPQLLDWLAVRFVEEGWSIKQMHRLMMNSRTYRQSSRISDDALRLDPQNGLLSRMPLRRMDAEALRDSLLLVSGQLDETAGGPPDPVSVDRDGLVSVDGSTQGGWRRSVYLQYRRTEIPTLMDTFDYPEMGPNCTARNTSTVTPQALLLMNNAHVRELAGAMAERVREIAGEDAEPAAVVQTVYRLGLSRDPDEQERQLGIAAIEELQHAWNDESQAALTSYCHTLLNSAAFAYVD